MKVIRLKEAKLNLNPGEMPNQAVQQASQFIDSNPVLRQISDDITLQNDGKNAILKYSYYKALPDKAYNELKLHFNIEDDFEASNEEANKITYILMPKVNAYKQFGHTAGFGNTLQSKLEALVREVLNEAEEGGGEDELKQILKADYPTFVQKLGQNIQDPKFLAAVKSLAGKDKVTISDMAPEVKNLLPTQNEIAADKSLKFPLTNVETATAYLKGGTVAPIGKKIVTAGGGKYIVDGHHRWSQVYVLCPDCKIDAIDMSDVKNPMDALKSAQLGIAADIGKVPTAPAGGVNMLKSGESEIKKFVMDTITDDVVELFKKFKKGNTKEEIADFVWNNVKAMQQNNQPVAGAPKRDIMPQTDDAPQWKDNAADVANLKETLRTLVQETIAEFYDGRDDMNAQNEY
jgi:hypothetical protein